MEKELLTLYKLIVLYMLDCVPFPLTRAQVDTFILEKEYTDYLTLQQAIGELAEAKMVMNKTLRNRTQLILTEEGRSTLHFFENQISDAIKEDIRSYLKENSIALRNEVSVTTQYHQTEAGDYETILTSLERNVPTMELHLRMPDEKTAVDLCTHFEEHNEEIYEYLLKTLL